MIFISARSNKFWSQLLCSAFFAIAEYTIPYPKHILPSVPDGVRSKTTFASASFKS
jgi:hypothetical protein